MAVELRVHFESYNYLLILLIVRGTMPVYNKIMATTEYEHMWCIHNIALFTAGHHEWPRVRDRVIFDIYKCITLTIIINPCN